MNKILFPAILVIVALLFGAYFYFSWTSKPAEEGAPGPAGQEEETATPETPAKDVTAEENIYAIVGDTFTITLDSNATTGYTWRVQHDTGPIRMTARSYREPQASLLGAPGTETFTFEALAPGEAELQFAYWREWEGENSVVETKVYHVNVSPVGK